MENSNISIIKFMFEDDFKALDDALNIRPEYKVEKISSANELASFLSAVPAGLIVAALKNKNDLIQIATFLKIVKSFAKNTVIKLVVINFCGDPNYERAIAKLGIQDLVEPTMNTKAIKFKLDFWMKSLGAQVKNNINNNDRKVKSLDAKGTDAKVVDVQTPTWLEPLDLESDIWLLKNENDHKKVMGKWLIRLVGPSPYVGQWLEQKPGCWRFELKEADKKRFLVENGDWFYKGDQKPDFLWKENVWLISGDNFDLYFKESIPGHSRLKSENKKLSICKNSLYAKTKESSIIETFDKDLIFKRQVESLENLEGKNKTDHLNISNLSGKNKTSEAIDGNLTGETEGENKKSGHWGNKSNFQEAATGDSSGPKGEQPREGSRLEMERKDLEHQKYYKNHNEAQQFGTPENRKEKKNTDYEEEASGSLKGKLKVVPTTDPSSLSGKTETDHLKTHYGDGEEKKSDKNKKAAVDERSLGGKSSTDHFNGHYGIKTTDQDRKETKQDSEKSASGHKNRQEEVESNKDNKASPHFQKERNENNSKEKKTNDVLQVRQQNLKPKKGSASNEDKVKNKKEYSQLDEISKDKSKKELEETNGASSKTQVERNWEGDHDFEMKGKSATDKIASHYKAKKNDSKKDNENEKASEGEKKIDNVLPLVKTSEEIELEEITKDARVISSITLHDKVVDCEFDDFFDQTVIFHTQDDGLAPSAKVTLDLVFKFLKEDSKLKMQGDIMTVEGDGDGNSYVTIKLTKSDASSLEDFMKLFEMRQQNIDVFLKKTKGL
jgi:hypothetical protein